MNRLAPYLDRVVDLGLIFLLVFTPLAFGAVEEWAKAIAQLVIMLIFAAWILKLIWTRARPRSPGRPPPADRSFRLPGGRIRLSGLEAPALLFALVVGFQLVPLPPSWLQVVSPRTVEIYAQSLPGYGDLERPSFAVLSHWLGESPGSHAGGVPVLPPDPEAVSRALPPEVFEIAHPAWRGLSLSPAATRRALQIFLAHLAFFVLVFNWVDRQRAYRYMYLLTGLAGSLAGFAILQELTSGDKLYWWRRASPGGAPFGPFVSRNNFAGWMEMVLPVCVGLTAIVWHWHRERGRSAHKQQEAGGALPVFLLIGFATILGLAAFLNAGSRGGLLAMAGAAAIYAMVVLLRERPRTRTVVALVVIIGTSITLAGWIGGSELWSRYETLGNLDAEPSFRFRLAASRQTLGMAKDFPWFGTGFGTFEQAFYLYSPGTSHKSLARTHNDYAQLVAEAGLLGAVAMIWGLFVLARRAVIPGLIRDGSAFRWPIRGIAVGVLALLLHSFADFNLQIYSNSMLFVFLCAVLLRDRSQGLHQPGRS